MAKVKVGSLNSMHSAVKDKKAAAAKTPLSGPRDQQKAFKSREFIQESGSSSESSDDEGSGSDSDVDIDAERKKFAAKVAGKSNAAGVKVNGAKSTPAKPATNVKDKTKAAPKPLKEEANSDSDSQSDSDSSGSNENTSTKTGAKKQGVGRSESTSSSSSSGSSDSEGKSDSDSDGEGEAGANVKPNNQGPATTKQSTQTNDSSSEESDSGESSSSGESSDEDSTTDVHVQTNQKTSKKVDGNGTTVARVNGSPDAGESSTQISRPPWLNNSEFMLRKASSDNPGREVTDFFKGANLEDKQVWYFTAPASLPITVLKDMEIDMSKATTGGALLKHKGDDYSMDLESYATNTQIQLLIPSKGGDKYTALNHGIDSTVHLRRMAKFGPGGDVSATATEGYEPQPKAIRPQPEGLKTRYVPIGVPNPAPQKTAVPKPTQANTSAMSSGSGSDSSSESESESESNSDEEMTTPPKQSLPTSSIPTQSATPGAANIKLKRKHASDEEGYSTSPVKESAMEEKPSKKPKTAKSTPSADVKKTKFTTSTKMETPIHAPNLVRIPSASSSTPSRDPPASKDKSKKAKGKSPEKRSSQTPMKVTPIPPPSLPGMRQT